MRQIPAGIRALEFRLTQGEAERRGAIRMDSVHQGELNGIKGCTNVNLLDRVTQWRLVASVRTIAENPLLPVIAQMLRQFPLRLPGPHADNGSEYVNYRVAGMPDKPCAPSSRAAARA